MPRETTTEYFSGQGIVYLAEIDANGVSLGFRDIGNVPDLKLSFSADTVEKKESRTGLRLTAARQVTGTTATASITLDGFDADTIKTAMFATATDAAAETGVAETLIARLGKVVPLGKIKVSSVVLKDYADTITYVEGKNYTVNTEAGSIYFLTAAEQSAASAVNVIADADDIHAVFSHAAQTRVSAFKDSQKTYKLRFEGLNTAKNNEPVVVTLPNFRPDPLKDLSMISNDFQSFVMEGAVLADTATGDFAIIDKL